MVGDFQEAATALKGKANLVDLDATVEKDLAKEYGVKGFPTLKLFSKGELVSDYQGGRTKDDIVKYIERAMLPSITECADAGAVAKFAKDGEGKAIFFGAKLDKLASAYKKASMSIRDTLPDSIAFGSVADVALLKELAKKDVAADSVFMLREDGTSDSFSGDADELEGWIKIGALPVFGELSRANANMYTDLKKPVFILFQDPAKKNEKVMEAISAISKERRSSGELAFVWIDQVQLKTFQDHLGVGDNDPSIAIYSFEGDTKYTFTADYTPESLKAWVADFAAGKLSATKKTEAVPETNDEPVKIVVGDSWEDIVADKTKDVLVEQYAPWCGHCKKLAPVLDELAAELSHVETLVIAKMDATKNDAPADYKASGFPTMHFCAAGKECVVYEGGREKADFVKYFQENATNKEGIELKPAKDEKTDEKEKEEL